MPFGTWNKSCRTRRILQALGNFFFCAGVVILPNVAMADFTVWLACQNVSEAQCLEMISTSIIQASLVELGAVELFDFRPAPQPSSAIRWASVRQLRAKQ